MSDGYSVSYLELEVPLLAVLVGEVAAVVVIVDVLRSLFVLSSPCPSTSPVSSATSPSSLPISFLWTFLDKTRVVVLQLLLEGGLSLGSFDSSDFLCAVVLSIIPGPSSRPLFPG